MEDGICCNCQDLEICCDSHYALEGFALTNRHNCGKFMKWVEVFDNFVCRPCTQKLGELIGKEPRIYSLKSKYNTTIYTKPL